ncbi:MAG: hypothetical protein EBZ47_00850 [Chlamydiae bacterium]|nr:hypothetical protein [Chlamydiota bacterium]
MGPQEDMLIREWAIFIILISSFIIIISTSIFSRSYLKTWSVENKLNHSKSMIEINLTGEVCCPGIYKFPPGTSLKEVIKVAGMTAKADKKNVNLNAKYYFSSLVNIPRKNITLKGKKVRSNHEIQMDQLIKSNKHQN